MFVEKPLQVFYPCKSTKNVKAENQKVKFHKQLNCKKNTCDDEFEVEFKLTFKRGQTDSTEFTNLTESFYFFFQYIKQNYKRLSYFSCNLFHVFISSKVYFYFLPNLYFHYFLSIQKLKHILQKVSNGIMQCIRSI